jgi:hypothetical protein
MNGSLASMHEIVALIEAVVPESHGKITFAEPGFPSPDQFDAGPLVELIGPLPRTPLPEAMAATIALFREKVAKGEMAADALLR